MAALAVISGLVYSWVAIEFLPVPFAWLGFFWAIVLLLPASPGHRLRKPIALAAALLSASELFLHFFDPGVTKVQIERTVNGDPDLTLKTEDDVFGDLPRKSAIIRAKRYEDDELIFDASYTIGPDGMRRAHPGDGRDPEHCLLFVGGSDVFGEGLNDEQTLPWVVGELSGTRTVSVAYSGWGAHQILSAWEHGWMEKKLDCEPSHGFFLADYSHPPRVAGRFWWDFHGPRFELQPDGSLAFSGHFDDDRLLTWLQRARFKSEINFRFLRNVGANRDQDFVLFVEILADLERRQKAYAPNGTFHVLLWPSPILDDLERALDERGVAHHAIVDALEGYSEDRSPYVISELDSHPNAHANRVLAEYVVEHILADSPSSLPSRSSRGARSPSL